ncbi:hypothetical protein MATL_G00167680 [Megalops atlanticus]|uniref:Uncharacterized protein n=1 Tax=Megalops atlanticus TaxID=7932 RepID=A0A9D3PNP2_MEGAT|nr:hypothetical protein MATL_G00167680 [Megalops atlanticus]
MDFEFIGLVILIFLGYVMPIIFGVIGTMHLSDCPQQPYIPIYLGVGGLVMVLAQLPYLSCCKQRVEGKPELHTLLTVCKVLLFLILIGWFLAGSVWIYSIYPPNYDPSAKVYCAKTLYLLAFWLMNVCYICIGLGLVGWFFCYLRSDHNMNICSFFRSRLYTPMS